jgi:hypothetical protein
VPQRMHRPVRDAVSLGRVSNVSRTTAGRSPGSCCSVGDRLRGSGPAYAFEVLHDLVALLGRQVHASYLAAASARRCCRASCAFTADDRLCASRSRRSSTLSGSMFQTPFTFVATSRPDRHSLYT